MYRKFFVYLDDGKSVYRIAVAASCEESAALFCAGNGEVIAVKDVTDQYPIDAGRVFDALKDGGFGQDETDFICRLLTEFGVAD